MAKPNRNVRIWITHSGAAHGGDRRPGNESRALQTMTLARAASEAAVMSVHMQVGVVGDGVGFGFRAGRRDLLANLGSDRDVDQHSSLRGAADVRAVSR